MISDFKLKAIVICCLVVLTVSLTYGWYTISEQKLPNTFGFCMIGIMGSLYVIGLTFDRYRRALYAEALRLRDQERIRADDLYARLHVRDITMDRLREDLERQQLLSRRDAAVTADVTHRISQVIATLNAAVGNVSTPKGSDQV